MQYISTNKTWRHSCLHSAEWNPALLRFPSPGSSDLLGANMRFHRGAQRHAGGLALPADRSPCRRAALLHSLRLLWWGEGLPAETRVPGDASRQGVWPDSGNSLGEITATQQPDKSWGLSNCTCVTCHVLFWNKVSLSSTDCLPGFVPIVLTEFWLKCLS